MTNRKRGRPADPNKKITLICPVCGSEFIRFKSKVKKNVVPTCSTDCGDVARQRTMAKRSKDPNWRKRVLAGTARGIRRARKDPNWQQP